MTAEAKETDTSTGRVEEAISEAAAEVRGVLTPYGVVQLGCTDGGEINAAGRALTKGVRDVAGEYAETLVGYATELKLGRDLSDRAVQCFEWLHAIEALASHVVDVSSGRDTSSSLTTVNALNALERLIIDFRERFGD